MIGPNSQGFGLIDLDEQLGLANTPVEKGAMQLELEEWEIWHTYTTYLDNLSLDLAVSAAVLIESGVADCVMASDGQTWWRRSGSVAHGITTFAIDSATGAASFSLMVDGPNKELPQGFALEAWGQAAYFIVGEHRVLGDEPSLSEAYIRAYLGKCVVKKVRGEGEESESFLYPLLVVYASGVLVLEFRMISPPSPVQLEEFISSGVNLPREHFTGVLVNPGLARNATAAYYRSSRVSFLQRFRYAYNQHLHDLAIQQRTATYEEDDFSFELSPWSGTSESLREVALTIFHTCAYLVTGPRKGVPFLLFGPKSPPDLGEFWSGRPHVHLIRFRDQRQTAHQNERAHGEAFAAILARTPASGLTLPKNLRLFPDYGIYLSAPASLWVWSQQGLSQQEEWSDPNRGNFIYERQAVMELLEYGYMLHRGLYHRAGRLQSTADVMDSKKQILRLRLRMREASHSGEIRALLEAGWAELGLPILAQEIENALSLREAEMRSVDSQRATQVGWAIAVVFGFVAVPALADQVVIPAWHLLKVHPSGNPDKSKLVAALIALVCIVCVLTFSLLLLGLARRRRT